MRAYKFLRRVGSGQHRFRGPFSGFAWPLPEGDSPGPVVGGEEPPKVCETGIAACRLRDLPYWIQDSLWIVELAGEITEADIKLVASRGRLLSRVTAWNRNAARKFAADSSRRIFDLAAATIQEAGFQAVADGLHRSARGKTSPSKRVELARKFATQLGNERAARELVNLAWYVVDTAECVDGGAAADAGYIAARAAGYRDWHFGGADGPEAGQAAERARQSEWFRDNLALSEL